LRTSHSYGNVYLAKMTKGFSSPKIASASLSTCLIVPSVTPPARAPLASRDPAPLLLCGSGPAQLRLRSCSPAHLLTLLAAPWRAKTPFHYKLFNF
jgi:hypothetical protein